MINSSRQADTRAPARTGGSEYAFRRDRIVVIAGLVLVGGLAWAYTLFDYWRMHNLPMSEMWMPPTGTGVWSVADFALTFVMWSVMMVAMMVPSASPMVAMFATVNRRRRQNNQPYVPTFVFLTGYLIAWVGYSAAVTLVQWPLHAFGLLTPMMDNRSYLLAGTVLIAAGVYQWTPWKDACLKQCRSPLGFLMTQWREGATGALSMGVKHGLFCVGCCWTLMLILFAVGVMNLLWVALITLFVLAEKVTLVDPLVVRGSSGALLVGWGIWMLVLI